MRKPLTVVGITITALYLILWGAVLLNTWPGAKGMPLNEWGDFFAGAVAPLAFLWLVLGYFQQSEELRQNTAALRLQAEQLKQQVAETKLLVQETSAQAKASAQMVQHQLAQAALEELRAMPRFADFRIERPGQIPLQNHTSVHFKNVGSPITHLDLLEVEPEAGDSSINPHGVLGFGEECSIWLAFEGQRPDSFGFTLTYIDENVIQRVTEFRVHGREVILRRHFERLKPQSLNS